MKNLLKIGIYKQLVRLPQFELESFLQPLLHLLGKVATKRPRDLWHSDNQLCQRDIWAKENELPKQHGREGADNLTHQGFAISKVY